MREDQVLSLVDDLYEAAIEPDLWPAALARFTTMLGYTATTVVPLRAPASMLVSPGIEEAYRAYARDWWRQDTIVRLGVRLGGYRGLVCDWERLGAEAMANDPFYQEFRRTYGMGGYMGLMVEPLPGEIMSVGMQLPIDAPPPGPDEQRRFRMLGRHAVRALAVTMRTSALRTVQGGLAEALTRFDCAAAVLDGRGRVVLANTALEQFASDGLKIVAGVLRAAQPADQGVLDDLIRTALGGVAVADGPDLAVVRRASGRHPLLLRAVPLPQARREHPFSAVGERFALILVVDLDRESGDRPEAALRLLGLTPAEARAAALVGAGRSPREAAETLGIADGTVRILLKRAYEKLDVSRQSELARLVLRLSALASREPRS